MSQKIFSQIKRLIVKLLVYLLKAARAAASAGFVLSVRLFSGIGQAFIPFARKVAFQFYKIILFGQRQFKQLGLKSRAGWLNLITHRHFLNFLFLATCLLIIGANFLNSNQVKAQDYGQQSLIYTIIGQNSELIEDTTAPSVTLPDGGTEDLQLATGEEETSEESTEDTMMLNSGGLVRLDIVSPEELQRSRTTQYVIQTGDTLYSIAQKFQISVNTILWANNLTLRSTLKPGSKLLILPTTGVAHKVKRGDTLNSIAKQYGTTKEKIESFNHVGSTGLVIGEIIIIPDGKIIYQAPTPTKIVSKPITSPKPAISNSNQVTGTGEMVWPTACRRITQYFRGSLHTGVDIACGMGVPLYAADSGTVVSVIYGRTGYGYHIIINHGNGKYTLYGHASKIYVEPGETVERGQVIAAMGSTGRSTGPHLHFEVRLRSSGGTRVNPLPYIR